VKLIARCAACETWSLPYEGPRAREGYRNPSPPGWTAGGSEREHYCPGCAALRAATGRARVRVEG